MSRRLCVFDWRKWRMTKIFKLILKCTTVYHRSLKYCLMFQLLVCLCKDVPTQSTYSCTLWTVSVHVARKPSWNMPGHASINQSVTVTHEDLFHAAAHRQEDACVSGDGWLQTSACWGDTMFGMCTLQSPPNNLHSQVRTGGAKQASQARRGDDVAQWIWLFVYCNVSLTSVSRRNTSTRLMSQSCERDGVLVEAAKVRKDCE